VDNVVPPRMKDPLTVLSSHQNVVDPNGRPVMFVMDPSK